MSSDIQRLVRRVPGALIAGLAVLLLASLQGARSWLWSKALEAEQQAEDIDEAVDDASAELDQARSLRDLRRRDLAGFKAGLPGAAQSRRAVYEAGLGLQEEKRLLEKQWEIISTYVQVDAAERKVHIMRGDQSLESFPLLYEGPTLLGGETRNLPAVVEIVSKERFAHPERGKSETVNGKLEWTPPQVGSSVRANALGEYVIFTRGPLVLHGPPRLEEDHRKFPHACLGLSLRAARRLFEQTYIGTKIYVKLSPSQRLPSLGFAEVDVATRAAKAVRK
jgi:hypothetical protein